MVSVPGLDELDAAIAGLEDLSSSLANSIPPPPPPDDVGLMIGSLPPVYPLSGGGSLATPKPGIGIAGGVSFAGMPASGLPRSISVDSSDDEGVFDPPPPVARGRQKSLPDLFNPPAIPQPIAANAAPSKDLPPPPPPSSTYPYPYPSSSSSSSSSSASSSAHQFSPPPPGGYPTSSLPAPLSSSSSSSSSFAPSSTFQPPFAGQGIKNSVSVFSLNSSYAYEVSSNAERDSLLYETGTQSAYASTTPLGKATNQGPSQIPQNQPSIHFYHQPHQPPQMLPYQAQLQQMMQQQQQQQQQVPLIVGAPGSQQQQQSLAASRRIVEVQTCDGSISKKIEVYDDNTAMDLLNKFAGKAGLQDSGYFSLAVPERGYDRWLNLNQYLKEQNVPNKVILKLQFIKSPKVFKDPVSIHFYWMQINSMVLTGYYPISDYLAVKLAALSVQAKYGNHDPNKHKSGFFSNSGNELKDFLPPFHLNKFKREYWERRIFLQHRKYYGMPDHQARSEYIRVARKSPSYGCTFFEVMSGAYALLGIAEDGVLLSPLRNSKCGDWVYFPFEKIHAFKLSGPGIELYYIEGPNRPPTSVKLGLSDGILDSAFATYNDYLVLHKMRIDYTFVPPPGRFFPPSAVYEEPIKRTLLADFPSRLELFKECYVKSTTDANSRPLLFILEQIDFNLDLGRDCELLNLNASNLDVETWQLIRNALLETFSYKPPQNRIFVENFNCKTLKAAQNPKLGAEGILSMIQLLQSSFPVESLDLSGNDLTTEKDAKALGDLIAQCRKLLSLSIRDNRLGSKFSLIFLKSIKENTGFRTLDLSNCDLKDLFCFPLTLILSSHNSLMDIDLSFNPITDDGLGKLLDGIKRSKTLTRLNLSGTKVKSHGVKKLITVCSTIGRPHQLLLAGTKLSEKTAIRFGTMISQRGPAGVLKVLDVQNTQLSRRACLTIAQSLETNQTVDTLLIGANELDKLCIAALTKSLRTNMMLKTLSLKNCSLGLEGYVEVGNLMKGNASITDLDLSYNTMGPLELKKIADAILSNRTVSILNVSYNPKISLDGVSAFMNPFSSNTNIILTKVFMDGCNIGDEGAKKVADMLRQNTTLEKLSLRDNNITNEGASAIFNALNLNKKLGHLSLEKNEITLHTDPKLTDLKNMVSMSKVIVVEGPPIGKK